MTTKINGTNTAANPAITGADTDTGLSFGSDTVNINTGGSTRATVDSSGRLLIGTTTAGQDDGDDITIATSGRTGITIRSANDNYGNIFFSDATSGVGEYVGAVQYYHADNSMRFKTSSTDRLLINSEGFLKAKGNASSYINANGQYHELIASTGNQLILNTRHTATNGYGILMEFNHGNSTYYALQVYNYASGSHNMYLRTDGDLENINNSYGGISDVKLKENIVDAESQWNDIKALKVRNYNLKADESKTKLLGLVAQEAEAVCPSLVKSQPDLDSEHNDLGTKTKVVKYSILYMKAIKALQEAQARIETLEAEKTQMQTDLTALTARVTALEAG